MNIRKPRSRSRAGLGLLISITSSTLFAAAPAGPEPQVPDGGAAPGAFPNSSVTGVNVDARGSSTFDSNVEIRGINGQGPIPWSINRYNRGDIALRLSPGDPKAALSNLNQGFIEFADNAPSVAANQAWRPDVNFGVAIPTARTNGPVDWNDQEGPFFPTIALSESSSGPGYSMMTGEFGTGNLDINLGKAGTHASSPEANFPFSVTWFPYDQGWLGGEAAGPDFEGRSAWTQPGAHSPGLAAGNVRWLEFPVGSLQYGGLAEVNLPGVNSLTDGMLFAASSDGSSDLNILGVAPREEGRGWLVAIREDSALDGETLVDAGQSEFQFVYVPYDASGLIGGHIDGDDGSKIEARGEFTITRTGTGTYSVSIPGKTAEGGTFILQPAELEPGTVDPMPTRAFMGYEAGAAGSFIIQTWAASSDTSAEPRDTDFYLAWIDFENPLSPPEGPRFRSLPRVALSDEFTITREAGIGVNTHEAEVLVTTIDGLNTGGHLDPVTGEFAQTMLIGFFVNPNTLEKTGDAFPILGNPAGDIIRHDVVYNAFSKQYIVVANARAYGPNIKDVPLIAIVNPASAAGGDSPVVKAFAHDENTQEDYDDVAVAASSQNGNFILVAEHDFEREGEGSVGVLFDKDGNLLTQQFARLDTLQGAGDEDDPDVKYLEGLDVFLYTSNTDWAEGVRNRVSGAIIQTVPSGSGALQVGTEQLLATDRLGGVTEGHPASIESPFNGEILTVFDLGGNNVSQGGLSYVNVGPAPGYEFTQAREETTYLDGVDGDPLRHNHPQIAADPNSGVFVVGHNAYQSSVGLPDGYVFTLYGPDGAPLPSQLGAPYFLTDTPGGTGGGANVHNIKYSPVSDSFLAVFTTSPGVTYISSLEITSNHLEGDGEEPVLEIERSGEDLVLSWEAPAAGFVLESTTSLADPEWVPVGEAPVQEGGMNRVTVTPEGPARFYRLAAE